MSSQWGTLGAEQTLEGASSRAWTLRFERRLAPREGAAIVNPASSVWLVRDRASARLYAAKRQQLAALDEVDALVDEAAAWRAACLADDASVIPELVDVFVARTAPFSVTFLAEFCGRGLLPKDPPLSEAVLLTIAADLADAADKLPEPHGHIAYESLLVDDKGCIRLAGFGAHRSAILRDNPGLNKQDDAFDIGVLLYELVFGGPPPEDLQVPESPNYSRRLTDIIVAALGHAQPAELRAMAMSVGAELRAPMLDVEKKNEPEKALPQHISRATERNVDRLVSGTDIGTAFSTLLEDLNAEPEAVASAVFKHLFTKPVSKDPLCAMRVLTMLHNLMLDGPDTMLAAVRKNDKFLDWTESSWTREAIEASDSPDDAHPATFYFAGGELAFYAATLRRKARFHMLAAGAFSGRWDRTGKLGNDGRDVLVTRRRKVIGGMADVMEMASEIGCRLAAAKDAEAAVKQAALGALVSECSLAAIAGVSLAFEVETIRDAEKVAPGVGRLHHAARALVFAVEQVPSAGGEQWVEQFASEEPPDVVANAAAKENQAAGLDETADIPLDGWAETEKIVNEEKAKKKEMKERKKKKKEKAAAKAKEEAEERKRQEDITAADGALVVHGAEDAATKAVTTMFGDLLAIDQASNTVPVSQPEPRPVPNMSNAQALASAFGVPEESVGGQHLPLPPPEGYGDDDDEGGGYDDYRARQEENSARQNETRQSSSTAAWAARSARSGHSSGALVVSDGPRKKSHPAFCQCAICHQEEAQAAALEAAASTTRSDDVSNSYDYGNRYHRNAEQENYGGNDYAQGTSATQQEPSRPMYGDAEKDSLDDEEGEQSSSGYERRGQTRARPDTNPFYEDDYDSYESITYSLPKDTPAKPEQANPVYAMPPPGAAFQMPEAEMESRGYSLPSHAARVPPPSIVGRFTVKRDMILNMKKLRMGDRLSDSGTVTVHKGEYNRETVAIKKLTKTGLQSAIAIEEFTNEVKWMTQFSSPVLLKCVAASLQKPNYIFVTELMKRGTLFDVLHKNRIKLTWAMIRKIALQLAEGMSHMHEKGILHRDLKSLNIFVDGSYNVKIGDFGFSAYEQEQADDGIVGTFQYMAPEVLRGEPHTTKSDVFAFAQVLCEIVSGMAPFQGMDARGVAERVVSEDIRPAIPMHCQRAYVNLIQMCWGTVPSTRPSFSEVIELIKSTTK
ncbi:Serine/threonine-protein kinase [Chondrus crispus]|uniref:Serine/threonine-protein kinase n=1 Tax=Chondrus crispus TaxID=2769 RepID=R7Q7P1_CHOCR|nr:Serine/threonine-protein kinase [Chondrus crispus]CDF34034.1 Serine/threonine-protein kinase [Chondrus crispus]|eukprot:XP_005713853.1 Serine/threonine-protein kinase [Chondrus crispus]